MDITAKAWQMFISRLALVNSAARDKILVYLGNHPIRSYDDRQRLIEYAYLTAIKYGEGAAALACAMYDAIAAGSAAAVPAAIPAAMPTVSEVAKAVNGTLKTGNNNIVADSIGRLVKRTGVDTTLINAQRDNAEFAWVPSGDTCAYCLMLAAIGWQKAGKNTLNGEHAKHIHANCDCTYAVRFDSSTRVSGYDPEKYGDIIEDATDGKYGAGDLLLEAGRTSSWSGRNYTGLNMIRRKFYAENADEINAQKRDAYEKRKERESSAAEEIKV